MSQQGEHISPERLRTMVQTISDALTLGSPIHCRNLRVWNNATRLAEFADRLRQGDLVGALGMLKPLELAVTDEARWIADYVSLAGDIHRVRLQPTDAMMRELMTEELVPATACELVGEHWEWRRLKRTLFIYVRNALLAARERAVGAGHVFRSHALVRSLDLSPEEEDLLALLLHYALNRPDTPEGHDLVQFLAFDFCDTLRHLHLLSSGTLLTAGLVQHISLPFHSNLLADDYRITNRALCEWAGVVGPPVDAPETEDSDLPRSRRRLSSGMRDMPDSETPPSQLGELKRPHVTLDDVVLPADVREQIMSALVCVQHRDELGGLLTNALFDRGRGCTILLYGPPGTGKTLIAEAIAHELGRDLMSAVWSALGSAYWWTTENNLGNVFTEAAERDAVLLLDEVDMLNARSDTLYSGQQHINRLVNVLLIQLENAPPGSVIILATNRGAALDPAIDRRLTLKLEIPPAQTEADRSLLWQAHLKSIPLDGEVEETCTRLSGSYPELDHGGHIKQAVMAAIRRQILQDPKGTLSLDLLHQSAQSVIQQLGLKRRSRMGFAC